jgi:hypothetical protein
MNTLQTISAAVAAIGAIGGGALTLESRYTHQESFYRHVAESRTGIILDLVERARGTDSAFHDSLCRALEEEISALCIDAENHPICVDRGMYLERAGC